MQRQVFESFQRLIFLDRCQIRDFRSFQTGEVRIVLKMKWECSPLPGGFIRWAKDSVNFLRTCLGPWSRSAFTIQGTQANHWPSQGATFLGQRSPSLLSAQKVSDFTCEIQLQGLQKPQYFHSHGHFSISLSSYT